MLCRHCVATVTVHRWQVLQQTIKRIRCGCTRTYPWDMCKVQGSARHKQEGQVAELCLQRKHTAKHSSTFCLSRNRRWAVELVSLHKRREHS